MALQGPASFVVILSRLMAFFSVYLFNQFLELLKLLRATEQFTFKNMMLRLKN